MQTKQAAVRSFVILAALFSMTLPVRAHFVFGTPDAPAHNAGHLAPAIVLGIVGCLVAFSAYLSFKRR